MDATIVSELVALNKAVTEGALDALEAAVNGAERIARHQFASAWSIVRDSLAGASVLARVDDETALAQWRESVLQPLVNRFLADSRQHFELSVETQKQVTAIAEAEYAAYSARSSDALAKLSAYYAGDTQPLVDTVRQTILEGMSSLDEMRRVTRRLSELAESGTGASGIDLPQAWGSWTMPSDGRVAAQG